jgi:hypothetical protein
MGLGVEVGVEESVSPFGEVVGLVGGWEDKMRSATAWAVVNTTSPPAGVGVAVPVTEEKEEEETEMEGERGKE